MALVGARSDMAGLCFRQVEGSLNTAKQTAEILRQVISSQRLPNVGQAAVLIDAVKTVGLRMIAASPIG